MAKYRKRPVEVEAVQFDPWDTHRLGLPEGVTGVPSPGADNWGYEGSEFWLQTTRGKVRIYRGDWIVTDAGGWTFLWLPENFAASFEPIGEPSGDPYARPDVAPEARPDGR